MDTKVITINGNDYCIDPDGSVRSRAKFYRRFVPGVPLSTEGARNVDLLHILNWNELTAEQKAECGEQIQIYDEEAHKWQIM